MITYDQLFIGGAWTKPSDQELLDIRSPHDESLIGRAAQARPADVDRAVAVARAAFDEGIWPHTPPAERIAVLRSSGVTTLNVTPLAQTHAERVAAIERIRDLAS
jgi:acyl-CoA reductase-like NAD-dependent aldehyde dehydrogenase